MILCKKNSPIITYDPRPADDCELANEDIAAYGCNVLIIIYAGGYKWS